MNRRTFLKSVLYSLFAFLIPVPQDNRVTISDVALALKSCQRKVEEAGLDWDEVSLELSPVQQAAPDLDYLARTREWLDRVERDNEWYRRVTSEHILCIDEGKDGYDMTAVALFSKDSNGIMTLEDLFVSHYEDEIAEFLSSLPCKVNVVVSGQCARHGGKL